VSLCTDVVQKSGLSSSEAKKQGDRNAGWQNELTKTKSSGVIGDLSLPTYLILRPEPNAALKDGVPNGTILADTRGAIFDVPGFVRLLKDAQAQQVAFAKQPKVE
jgi:hypothetical protein